MPKIVSAALKAKSMTKAWSFKAKNKAQAMGPEARSKAVILSLGRLETKAWPQDLYHWV